MRSTTAVERERASFILSIHNFFHKQIYMLSQSALFLNHLPSAPLPPPSLPSFPSFPCSLVMPAVPRHAEPTNRGGNETGDYQVTWAVGDEEGTESTLLFHVDLYDCGNDQSCSRVAGGGACGAGDFVLGLCPEEGCYSAVGTASVSLPEVCFFLGEVVRGERARQGREGA